MAHGYSTAQIAAKAGVHKTTVLRWLKSGQVPEPLRDRRGWRIFSESDLESILDFVRREHGHSSHIDLPGLSEERLARIDWSFSGAKTNYLTHSIHPYPAKFIPQIPNALIQELSSVGDNVGDIFCGSGTTLVEAQLLKRNAFGVDANPISKIITDTKTARLTENEKVELSALVEWAQQLSLTLGNESGSLFDFQANELHANIPDPERVAFWFDSYVAHELGIILHEIGKLESEVCKTVAKCAFSSIVVAVSRQDSDTRYVRRQKNIALGGTADRFASALYKSVAMISEFMDATEDRFWTKCLTADILEHPEIPTLDLMVCSPPYPNAYSYHLYHQNRMMWLGLNQKQFKQIEIGSHRKYSSKKNIASKIYAFEKEMESILEWLRDRLAPRAYACFVVGDSTVNGKLYDNALLIKSAGIRAGFRQTGCFQRPIKSTRKSFNPAIGKIKTEKIVILRKA